MFHQKLPSSRAYRLLISFLLVCISMAATGQEQTITIGTVSGQLENASEMTFIPFTDYLDKRIPDVKFQMRAFKTIDGLIESVDQNQLDFAFITPAAFVELNIRHDLRPIATITQLSNDKPYPWLAGAVFAGKSSSDINKLSDVVGKRVVALSERALGGWLSAVREWRDLSIDVASDAALIDFVFSYAAVIDAVCTSRADIGVIAAGIFKIYNVMEAASGNEALALMRSHEGPIDLLLTDVVLSGFNGRELSERFNKIFPDAGILFTSGYPDEEIARRGILFGSAEILTKPYLPEDVLGKVREVLDNTR